MPRTTNTSKASDGAASSCAAGDEEKTMDENDARDREDRERERADPRARLLRARAREERGELRGKQFRWSRDACRGS